MFLKLTLCNRDTYVWITQQFQTDPFIIGNFSVNDNFIAGLQEINILHGFNLQRLHSYYMKCAFNYFTLNLDLSITTYYLEYNGAGAVDMGARLDSP